MNRARWTLLVVGSFVSCVDVAGLAGFECDDAGHCKATVDAGAGGGFGVTGGGGGSGGGGGATVVGGGSATGGGSGLTNGAACSAADACTSGFCSNGVCCESACTGACEGCNEPGWPGTCRPRDEGATTPACGAFRCNGVSRDCPTSCGVSPQCVSGFVCIGMDCVPTRGQGAACSSSVECASGFCADGVCCDSSCDKNCDTCNAAGVCTVSPAGTPGAPTCEADGGAVTCNGVVADCPITCTTSGGGGCPSGLYCGNSGFCSSKKTNGASCGAAVECTSGNCVDGVCCNSACGGDCEACSVAAGASVDGVCKPLGTSVTCRAAAGACDSAEKCDGVSATCPVNGFLPGGTVCASPTDGGCGTCASNTECATDGTRSCTRNDYLCTGNSATCALSSTTTPVACTLSSTDGDPCGTGMPSYSYGACTPTSFCALTGTQSRTRLDPVCQSSACGSISTTDTISCSRSAQTGVSCDDAGVVYGSCTRPANNAVCSLTGTQTVTTTTYACTASGTCAGTPSTSSTPCSFSPQTGTSCDTTGYGPWSACSYANVCSTSGTRTRSVTTHTCLANGTCGSSTSTETDTTGCARSTNGTVCRAATDLCDAEETCSGGACPADGVVANGVTCIDAEPSNCMRASLCDGVSRTCPAPVSQCAGIQICCDDGSGNPPYCIKPTLCPF